MWFWRFKYFQRPPDRVYTDAGLDFMDGAHTYGEYNYLRPGLASRVKTAHFEVALELTQADFGRCPVIDFGCADGVFLPSLAQHFPRVLAIDRVPKFVEIANCTRTAIDAEHLEVICNEGLSAEALRTIARAHPYQIAFCLEVIEHVGDPGDLYGAKIRLLEEIFSLLEPGGRIVLSVPTMVGLPFLIQRAALASLGIWREPLSWKALLKAGLLNDTTELEGQWDGGHLGFNHLRLEQEMAQAFRIERRVHIGFQVLYVIGRSDG